VLHVWRPVCRCHCDFINSQSQGIPASACWVALLSIRKLICCTELLAKHCLRLILQAPWPHQLADLSNTSTIAATTQQPTSEAVLASSSSSTTGSSDRNSISSTSSDPSCAGGSGSDFYHPCNVFKGVRARVGIWSGPMDRVLPHGKSGRADYLGPPANRAARMMGAAQGGQVSTCGACFLLRRTTFQRMHFLTPLA
jgi:hypothetical protein